MNAILVDFHIQHDWSFLDTLTKNSGISWEVIECASNRNHGGVLQKIIRYWKYFYFPAKVFLKRKNYSEIVAWQQFYGLILAFYCKILHVKKPVNVTIMSFIYKSKKGLYGKLYYQFVKSCVTSDIIKYFIVFSESEKKYYAKTFGISEDKIIPFDLGIKDVSSEFNISTENYYVSAGRSNRDYHFLIQALQNTRYPVKIICDDKFIKEKSSDNIEWFSNCHGKDYLKIVAHSKGVIIPLKDKNISSGQLVLLQAMMFGKPIIITQNIPAESYIVNRKTALVISKTKKDLLDALEQLEDASCPLYQTLSRNCREEFCTRFSEQQMGIHLAKLLDGQLK